MTDERERPYHQPTLERSSAGDLTFRFPLDTRQQLVIRLANLHAHHGDYTYNLWCDTRSSDGEPLQHLLWSKFNIAAESTRARMATALAKRLRPLDYDTDRALEYVCTKTYLTLQDGEPPVDLDDVDVDDAAPNELITGVMPLHQVTTLFAAGGSLKSYVALLIGIVARLNLKTAPDGHPGLPFSAALDEPVGVLYVDGETVKQEQALRMRKLCRGLGIPPVKLHYLRLSGALAESRDQLARLIERLGVRLLIVDSIAPLLGGSVNDDDLVNAFFDTLNAFTGVTSLVISHETKAQRRQAHGPVTPIGSGFVEYRSRACWYVQNETPAGADQWAVNKLVLTCVKANNAPRGRKLVVTFQWTQDGRLLVGTGDIRRDADLVQHRSNTERVRELLRDGQTRTIREIAETLGLGVATAKSAVSRLDDALVAFPDPSGRTGRGHETRYALTAYQDPVPIRRLVDDVRLDAPPRPDRPEDTSEIAL